MFPSEKDSGRGKSKGGGGGGEPKHHVVGEFLLRIVDGRICEER